METFSFGASYNRANRISRRTNAYTPSAQTSLTNYIASFMGGVPESDLQFATGYNPYEADVDWLGALAYNSYLINPLTGNTAKYQGLYSTNTVSDSQLQVYEDGYIDQYNFTFGGNFANTIYWGIGVGIDDVEYKRYTDYSESMNNAHAYNEYRGGIINNSNAEYYLSNDKRIKGTGWKLDFGLIFKPVNEFRIGAAVHTPTYYDLKTDYQARVDYSFNDPTVTESVSDGNPTSGSEYTDYAMFDWRLKSPWRFMIGAAGVIGNDAIISVDYERVAYSDMTIKNSINDSWGGSYYKENTVMNEDIRNYTRAGNIVRVGLEYRVTPQFSVRAGYNVQTSNIKNEAYDGDVEINTSGTDPSYSFDKTIQNVSVGAGYRFGGGWYLDGTYVYCNRESKLHPYTSFTGSTAPTFDVTDNSHSVVVSLGYKF
jgi:long-subunit fatty acid transport protein